jgi:hypothetical protein
MAPEPKSSSPYLQEQATGPYPAPTEFTLPPPPPPNPANLSKIHFDPILSSTPQSSKWSECFIVLNPKIMLVK